MEKEGLGPSLGLVGETWTSDRACGTGVSGTLQQGRGLGGQEVGQQNTPGFSVYLGRGEGSGMVCRGAVGVREACLVLCWIS